jgi:hypothetical protein
MKALTKTLEDRSEEIREAQQKMTGCFNDKLWNLVNKAMKAMVTVRIFAPGTVISGDSDIGQQLNFATLASPLGGYGPRCSAFLHSGNAYAELVLEAQYSGGGSAEGRNNN